MQRQLAKESTVKLLTMNSRSRFKGNTPHLSHNLAYSKITKPAAGTLTNTALPFLASTLIF